MESNVTLRELVERARGGETAAVMEIVRRFRDHAEELARALLGDGHLAEDAVQQTGFRRNREQVLRCVVAQVLQPAAAGGKGRLPGYGVLVPDGEVRRRIAEGQALVAGKMPEGCQDLKEDVRRLMREGLVDAGAGEAAIAAVRERV